MGVLLGGLALLGVAVQRGARGGPALGAVTAASTWVTLGGTTLARTGTRLADLLDAGDIDGARALLPSLCGRDPSVLDADGLARAALESVAENTSDAQVAPLLWAAAGGVPGVLVYRGANTLDAMIGNRSPRYAQFGWAAARLDDAANYVAARVGGALVVLCAPLIGGSAAGALRAWRRDAARHPSPNAGVVEATFAGALGVRLGGPTQYRQRTADRRVGGRCATGLAPRRSAASEPECRGGGGDVRRCTRGAARRAHPVPARAGDPPHPRRRAGTAGGRPAPLGAAVAGGSAGRGGAGRRAQRRRP